MIRKPMGIAMIFSLLALGVCLVGCAGPEGQFELWNLYETNLVNAKYVDLTHAFSPSIPVWPGFGNATFKAGTCGQPIPGYAELGEEFTYDKHGFVTTAYELPTDQYGTQLDPPAHFNPNGATIDQLPPTYSIRPLVVIDVHEKVAENPDYHATIEDIKAWETEYGPIPEGAFVAFRSDWSKNWDNPEEFNAHLPGVELEALKYLHEECHILMHGHEGLDTDTTATLIGETWLLDNNYCQAEGLTNLDQVPEAGALISIGYAKPMGGTGGYARYIAICPPDWEYGVSIKEVPGAPLPSYPELRWDKEKGMRVR